MDCLKKTIKILGNNIIISSFEKKKMQLSCKNEEVSSGGKYRAYAVRGINSLNAYRYTYENVYWALILCVC